MILGEEWLSKRTQPNGLAEMMPEKTADRRRIARARVPAIKPEAEEPMGETPDSVELYLNEIARYKLLRPDEEVSLAKEIENGRILDELSDAFMEEHLTVPTIEQLTVAAPGLLRRRRRSCAGRRRSRASRSAAPSSIS